MFKHIQMSQYGDHMYLIQLVAILALSFSSSLALAYDLSINSFGSIVGGEILTGNPDANTGNVQGPLYVADYTNGSVYTKKQPLIRPESKVGLQATASNIISGLSAVVQGIVRADPGQANLEWAYLSYQANAKITVQAGRKRIPIFFYSEFQDVGFAYAWVRPPGELYGWDVTNYDGGMIRYQDRFGPVSLNSSLFAGAGFNPKARNFKLWYPYDVTIEWNNIRGADAELNYDWLTTRFLLLRSTNRYNAADGQDQGWSDYGLIAGHDTKQDIMGWALNTDFGHFFTLGEVNLALHYGGPTSYRSFSSSIGAGYRIGKWSPLVNYSKYRETGTSPDYNAWHYDCVGLTLRYDVTDNSDFKLQYNKLRDMSAAGPFLGNTQMLSASYDFSI